MRTEVKAWVQGVIAAYKPQPPVLEVGALNINGTCRDLFPQKGYVGLDMQAGEGVDVVADITDLPKKFNAGFNTVVSCETLEHIAEPWTAIERMYAALKQGGLVIMTTVFLFGIHDYPSDYFRYTPDGLRYLLERAGFVDINIETEGAGPVGVFAVARKA